MTGINDCFMVNSSLCVATSYLKNLKQGKDETEVVGVIDFGAQGLTFSQHKLYFTDPGIVETLSYSCSHLGGLKLTQLLVNHVAQQLVLEKGMDITKNPYFMHKLRLLCDEAKHILSSNEKAFVRLDELPDILVYGCEVSIQQF